MLIFSLVVIAIVAVDDDSGDQHARDPPRLGLTKKKEDRAVSYTNRFSNGIRFRQLVSSGSSRSLKGDRTMWLNSPVHEGEFLREA